MKPLLLPLAALALCAPAVAAQRTLHSGDPVDGSLTRGDLRLDDGRYYDEYSFRARRGETVVVRLESEDFDAYLFLGEDDGRFRELARDDDGGDGTDARIRFVAPRDGRYLVRASSLRSDTGPYTLTLQGGRGGDDWGRGDDDWDRDRDRDDDRYLRPGRTVRDFLSRSDPRLDNGMAYHLYRYSGRRGERLSIHLHSEAFDSYLVLGTPGGRHGVDRALARDDDGGGGLDSHIQYTLPHDGEYVIRVNPVSGDHGRYVLEMRSSYRDDDRPRPRYPDDDDDGYDARIDERIVGRWRLEAPGRSVRDAGAQSSTGTLRIRATGEYLWVRQRRVVARGTLEPMRRGGSDRARPRYLLEERGEQFEVFFNGRALELRRRTSGQPVAEGYPDRGGGVNRSVEEVEWDAEETTILVEPADTIRPR